MHRWKARAIRTADQVRPVASSAREVAAHRIEDARIWVAPRLDRAAHSVEEQIAPKVSAFLSQAAEKMDPSPSLRRRGRWSTIAMLAGFTACAIGIVLYRNNARQWAESMKESAEDASRWVGDRAEDTADRISSRTDEAGRRTNETPGKTF
jgi:hypothetical protein